MAIRRVTSPHVPEPPPERVLFLTGGIGITPVAGMLRALARHPGRRPDTVLVHCAPDADRFVFGGELRALAARESWFRLYEHHTRRKGRPEVGRLAALCPDWRGPGKAASGPGKEEAVDLDAVSRGLRAVVESVGATCSASRSSSASATKRKSAVKMTNGLSALVRKRAGV